MSYLENPRYDVFKAALVEGARFSKPHGFPLLNRTDFRPESTIEFSKAISSTVHNQWIHFYAHDYRFECVWKEPNRYLPVFRKFSGVITPDYSLGYDMPLAMQIWNTYRNRVIGYWLQRSGINIIPNVRWGDERTYTFVFEGLMRGGSVAVSTLGCLKDLKNRFYFANGLRKMIDFIQPDTILCYGQMPDDVFGCTRKRGIHLINVEPYIRVSRKRQP